MARILALIIILVAGTIGLFGYKNFIAPSASDRLLPAGAVVLDVRTPQEYAVSHAPKAKLLPLQDIQSGVLPDASQDTAIALYCRSGNRSAEAKRILKEAGFTNIIDMGGLSDVEKYGLIISKL